MIEGLELTVLGMGAVFAFLIVLVATMALMSRIVMRLEDDQRSVTAPPHSAPDATLAAAIAAAVRKHRSREH